MEVSYRTLQWGWGGWRWRGASNSSSPASVLPSPCKILLTWHCDTVQLETCGHGSPQTFSQFLHRFRHSPVMFSPHSHGSGSLTRIWIWSWIVSSLSDFVCYRFLCSLLWFLCGSQSCLPVSHVSMVVSFLSASSSVSVSNGLWCFLFCFVFIPCVLFSFVSFVSCIPSCLPSPHNPACRATVLVSLCSLSCSPSFLHAVRSCVFTLIPALF